jgi:DNA-binding XRE family transcriptional regulator
MIKTFRKQLNDELKNPKFREMYLEDKKLIELAMLVHAEREKRNLSQSEVAKIAGVTQQQLSKVESGINCNLTTLIRILSALKLDIDFKAAS